MKKIKGLLSLLALLMVVTACAGNSYADIAPVEPTLMQVITEEATVSKGVIAAIAIAAAAVVAAVVALVVIRIKKRKKAQ